MKALQLACSGIAISAIFLTSIPAAQATYTGGPTTTNAAAARCNRVAGREKIRCENIHRRGERLQLRLANITARQRRTAREKRVVKENFSPDTIKGREGEMTSARRRHRLNGGNTRRQLQRGFEEARNKCKFKERTEQAECRKMYLRNAQRTDYKLDR